MVFENVPVPEPLASLVSPVVGVWLGVLYTTPRSETVEPPSAVTLPPSTARVAVMPVGVAVVTVGVVVTVKATPLLVPPGVVRVTGPVMAPAGTATSVMLVAEATVKPVVTTLALLPLKVMAVAPVKPVPVRLITVPTGPLVDERLVRVGAVSTVKVTPLEVPPGVVMVTLPVVAPAGTVAVAVVAVVTLKVVAAVPLKLILVAPVKPVPVMVTLVPIGPLRGAKLEMTGGGSRDTWRSTDTVALL